MDAMADVLSRAARPETTTTVVAPEPPAVDERPAGWRHALFFEPRWVGYVFVGLFGLGLLSRSKLVWGFLIVAAIGVTLERLWPRHPQPILRSGLRTDILHFMFTHFLQTGALLASAAICYVVLHRLTIPATSAWLNAQPIVVEGLIGFFVFTFLLYWQHRLAHTVPFLWRFHAVHHSSAQLDWVAAARLHPIEDFFGGFLLAPPIILLGFKPIALGIFSGIATAWAIIEHANVNWRLRIVDRIYTTPEYHHWHHSLHAEARDKNFGLPLWDTLFGTYYMPKGERPQVYGVEEPMPSTYAGQLTQPFRART
jgi:sterol desaturase/sphingolipid hydroxylase (fatty acid hydroxylase superfamily)